MPIQSVTGPLEPDALGLTLPHEHVLLDLRNQFADFADPRKQAMALAPLDAANLPAARRNPYAVKDNLLLDDVELAAEELRLFRAAGGATVVDCTSIGIGRRPVALRAISERTGVNIIAGCGYYTYDTHPAGFAQLAPERIAEVLVHDLAEGIGDTGVRAGIIGEIGTSSPIRATEAASLAAAALAHRSVPVPVYVHTYPWGRDGAAAARQLLEDGVPPGKIVICHVDVDIDTNYLRDLFALGVFVEFDNFGKEFLPEDMEAGFAGGAFATDTARVRAVAEVFQWGGADQLLVSNDICLKCMWRHYGGEGYANIVTAILPRLVEAGLDAQAVERLLTDNPRRLFA